MKLRKRIDSDFRNARRQHGLWMDILEEAVTESKIIPLQVDASRCAFGHFYSSLTIQDEDIRELWEVLMNIIITCMKPENKHYYILEIKSLRRLKKHHQIAKESSQKVNQIIDEITGILSK